MDVVGAGWAVTVTKSCSSNRLVDGGEGVKSVGCAAHLYRGRG